MDKKYTREIWKRIMERIDIRYGTRRATIISISVTLILNGIAYFTFLRLWGFDTANQQILSFFIGTVLLEVILLGLFLLSWRYYDVPEEIYNEQKGTIKKIQSDELKITFVEFESINNEGNSGLSMSVKNDETRKITELEARIEMVLKYYFDTKNEISESGWRIQSSENENILGKSEIRPDAQLSGIIVTYSDDFSEVKFGKSQEYFRINSSEAIYKIFIRYDGKIEGETTFRIKNIESDIYVKPSMKLICGAHIASISKIMNEDFEKKFKEYRKREKENKEKVN